MRSGICLVCRTIVPALWIAGLAGCTSVAAPGVILLGTTLPLSGPDALEGEAMRRGYLRAVAEANEQGGVLVAALGRRIPARLTIHDDGGEASRVEEAVDRLVDAGSLALLATAGPVRVAVEADRAERLGRPLIVNAIDAPGLPGARAQWTLALRAAGDPEARAYETARGLLTALEHTRVMDPAGVRTALLASSPAAASDGLTRAGSVR